MNLLKGTTAIVRLQWLIWMAVYLIIFFSLLPEEGPAHALIFSTTSVAFYMFVIYGNIKFLYPKLWERGYKALYVVCVIVFLVGGGLGRGYLVIYLANRFVMKMPEGMTLGMALNFVIAGVLNLLKSQVQPHFLFNTLNNIYYEAYREAPRTAGLIERLSDIMRYFVDESPKDEVSLQTEVQFIENYIALEKIRIRHDTEINFVKEYNPDARIPPMLLMTFVENIFKHGVDKSSRKNKIDLSLVHQNGYLLFLTNNRKVPKSQETSHGFGIENLRRRL